MNYSTEYTAVIVSILATLLPKFGVQVGSEEMTSIVTGAVAFFSGLYLLYKRYNRGGVTVAGFRK